MAKLHIDVLSSGHRALADEGVSCHIFPITGTAGKIENLNYLQTVLGKDEYKRKLQAFTDRVSQALGTWKVKVVATNCQYGGVTIRGITVSIKTIEDNVVGEDRFAIPVFPFGETKTLWSKTVKFEEKEEHHLQISVNLKADTIADFTADNTITISSTPLKLSYQSIIAIYKTLKDPKAIAFWHGFLYSNCVEKHADNMYLLDDKINAIARESFSGK